MLIICLITVVLLLIYSALLLYYRKGWKAIPAFALSSSPAVPAIKISIIIPARNEEQNIRPCIMSLLNQSLSKEFYEIIIVDDHSTDNTADVVRSFKEANIRLIRLQDFIQAEAVNSFKKKAIAVAIEKATGSLMVTTDADCIAPVHWLQTIAAFYKKHHPSFIVMPVVIHPHNNFIELFQLLDFMSLQGITGASVYKKMHSMCNGANLAYTKAAFSEVNGFDGIDSIASGDDMLLMHKIAVLHPNDIYFLKSENVIVQTQPVHTVTHFLHQRIRWASKARIYDDKRIFAVLLLVYLLNVMLLVLPAIALFSNPLVTFRIYPVTIAATVVEWWAGALIIKTMAELFFLAPVARFFNQQKTLFWFPVMQLFHILYTVIAGWLGQFGTYRWKDRTVK
ncbi:MAG: glycosyltransferase [Bacteroidetes bacterium]|nr:glycosyltransferase [Bacteroidota bacterium]